MAVDWTQATDKLMTLWARGESIRDIARAFGGIHPGAISGKLDRLGLLKSDRRPKTELAWTDDQETSLKAMRADGRSMRDMALELSVSRAAISGKLTRLGLTQPRRQSRASFRMPVFAPGKPYYDTQPVETTECLNMELLDMPERGCKYPTGENEHRFLFCGHERYGTLPYCAMHARLSYRPKSRQVASLPHGKSYSEHAGSSC